MNITRVASGRGCGGGTGEQAGREAGRPGVGGRGVGGWDGGEQEGARQRRGRGSLPPAPSPSSLPLLSVTKVQENYANRDKRLSQRGSLAGLYFLEIRLRNYLAPCSEHFQLRGKGKRTRRESSPDFGQFTSPATPKLRTSKPVSRGWDRASFS